MYILFENKDKQHLKKELNELPKSMENPFQILRRFIKWEMMDLEAIIETIDSKNEFTKRQRMIAESQEHNSKEIKKLQAGGSFKHSLMSKNSKIMKITELNEKIEHKEKEIDCAEVISKIVFLYLQDAAIPFFRQDKLGVYNGAINMYAQKQINNCKKISDFYEKVIGSN